MIFFNLKIDSSINPVPGGPKLFTCSSNSFKLIWSLIFHYNVEAKSTMTSSGPLQSGLVSLNGLKVKQTKIRRGCKQWITLMRDVCLSYLYLAYLCCFITHSITVIKMIMWWSKYYKFVKNQTNKLKKSTRIS